MEKTYIVRYGEIALKGQNKPYFERMLMERIKHSLKGYMGIEIKKNDGLIFVKADADQSEESLIKDILKVFGIASVSVAVEVDTDKDSIAAEAVRYMNDLKTLKGIKSFKVEAKRGNKDFPMTSPEICKFLGGKILTGCDDLKVDVHQPDTMLYVNVRRQHSYIYHEKIVGYGGLPLGTNGKGLLLLSGGIDSPVAGWMMAKRGMGIEAVHFHSYPYTSERAQEKVFDLARILAEYCGRIKIYCVNLIEIQQALAEKCPEEEMTILSRRFMMKIAEKIANANRCDVLITGESMGQVASQTIQGLIVTDNSVQLPVMRPLIALDKIDIMDTAKKIGTFETSIQPFEDCCTVFLPKHPVTKPKLDKILESEALVDGEELIKQAVEAMEVVVIHPE